MLVLRGILAAVMIALGLVILAQMLRVAAGGFAILPGVVLGTAMVALGAHRITLILRARRAR